MLQSIQHVRIIRAVKTHLDQDNPGYAAGPGQRQQLLRCKTDWRDRPAITELVMRETHRIRGPDVHVCVDIVGSFRRVGGTRPSQPDQLEPLFACIRARINSSADPTTADWPLQCRSACSTAPPSAASGKAGTAVVVSRRSPSALPPQIAASPQASCGTAGTPAWKSRSYCRFPRHCATSGPPLRRRPLWIMLQR